MPDPISRKRLKKKMLDRWENEGGSIGGDPAGEDRSAKEGVRKVKQSSTSRNNSTVGGPLSSTKKRKSARR